MHVRRARNAGFSLIEALFAVLFSALIVGFGVLYLGRKIVSDGDPVRTAEAAGYSGAMVFARRNFSTPLGTCGLDHVTFRLSAHKDGKEIADMTVCCPAWFGPCEIRE